MLIVRQCYEEATLKHFIDHPMNKVLLLLDKDTGEEAGKILAYYSDNPAGSVWHAKVILYFYGCNILGIENNESMEGKAGGYGYDKFSAAVADSLHKQNLGLTHDQMSKYVFRNSGDDINARKEQEEEIIASKKIPVYSGAGNVVEAFSLYFRVVEVL